jgi:hypothetical protein
MMLTGTFLDGYSAGCRGMKADGRAKKLTASNKCNPEMWGCQEGSGGVVGSGRWVVKSENRDENPKNRGTAGPTKNRGVLATQRFWEYQQAHLDPWTNLRYSYSIKK